MKTHSWNILNSPSPRRISGRVALWALLWLCAAPHARAMAEARPASDMDAAVTAGDAPSRPITLEIPIFQGGAGTSFFLSAARKYEKLRPGVKVDLYGDPRIADKVRVRILEGSYPNATDAPIDYWPLIRKGDVLPLDSYLDGPNWEGDGRWRDSFVTGALTPFTHEGKSYGVPFAMFLNVIWYNPSIFKAHGWTPPKTWHEFFDLCEKMRAAGVTPLAFQGAYPYYAEPIFASAYYGQAGLQAYQDFRKLAPGSFDNPAAIGAFQITQRFGSYFQKGAMGMTHTAAQLEFLLGHVAMIPCGAWLKSEMLGKIPDGFQFASFNLPTIQGGKGDPSAINAFSSFYFVMAHAKHPRETVDFLRFLTSRSMAAQFSRERDIPTAIRGANSGNLSPDLADIASMIDHATLNYGHAGEDVFILYPEMYQYWDDTLAGILNGSVTPTDAAKRLEDAARAVRAKAANPTQVTIRHVWQPIALGGFVLLSIVYLLTRLARDHRRAGKRGASDDARGGPLSWMDFLRFIGPALLIYSVFVVYPSVRAFFWSVHTWDGLGGVGSMTWAGLLNFKRLLLESDAFWIALRNNLFLMFVVPAFVVPLALLLAACLSRGIFGASLFRIVFFFPNLLGTVAVSLLWLHLYNPTGGLINALLVRLGFTGFSAYEWLSTDHLYWSLIPMSVWGACGFYMVLYLAAMQAVPEELYEAAEVEGASQWRQFWTITLPMIWDVLTISVVFLIIAGMKAFDIIWLLTNQRPTTKSHVIATRIVQTMFGEFDMGQATAMAVILFILVFLGSAMCMKVMQRETVQT